MWRLTWFAPSTFPNAVLRARRFTSRSSEGRGVLSLGRTGRWRLSERAVGAVGVFGILLVFYHSRGQPAVEPNIRHLAVGN